MFVCIDIATNMKRHRNLPNVKMTEFEINSPNRIYHAAEILVK